MPLPLTVSCLSKIQIGFNFLVPAYPGSPGNKGPLNRCVCVQWVVVSSNFHFAYLYLRRGESVILLVHSFCLQAYSRICGWNFVKCGNGWLSNDSRISCDVCADDAWMNVSSAQLDKMLTKMSGRPAAQITDLHQLTDSMKTFINKVSSHEGAELPGSVPHPLSLRWSKIRWVAVASAGPCASLHLAPDR